MGIPRASPVGAVAQLGERLNGIQEVRGSIPLGSTSDFNRLDDNPIEIAPTGERLADQRRTNLKILQFDRDPLLGATGRHGMFAAYERGTADQVPSFRRLVE